MNLKLKQDSDGLFNVNWSEIGGVEQLQVPGIDQNLVEQKVRRFFSSRGELEKLLTKPDLDSDSMSETGSATSS